MLGNETRARSAGVGARRRAVRVGPYRIVDPCVAEIFERALCLLEDAKSGVHTRAS